MSDPQLTLDDYASGTSTTTITRTVPLALRTSRQKNDLVRQGIDDFQEMAAFMADRLPTYPEYAWTGRSTTMYRQVTRAFPSETRAVKATIAREAQQKVAEAFDSWRSRGKPGARPQFGDGDYLRLSHQDLDIVENERGWGLKAGFIPYKPVWFQIRDGDYQREFLERITDPEDDASAGGGELRLDDDGTLRCMLTVSWDVEVYDPGDVETTVGVDLNDDPIVAIAVTDPSGDVLEVDMERGREYRHHREQLKQKRYQAMERGDLRAVKSARFTYDKYTDHVTNVASRRVVDLAAEHAPAVIHLEDLTHYRETAKDPIHDWPFAEIQRKIAYKALEERIPVRVVNPAGTSRTCRRCGCYHTNEDPKGRDGPTFECRRCGYEVHADVNAAVNIAERDADSGD